MSINVLVIMGRYLPGYKDGGPVRSIKNLTDALGSEVNFSILTTDRDHGDLQPYPNIQKDVWNVVGNAKVMYVEPHRFSVTKILRCSKEADFVYVCGCFNDYAIKTLILNRVGLINTPVIIASMGLFSPLAFKIRSWKKQPFVSIFNFLGMFKKVEWSVTSEVEKKELLNKVRADSNLIHIAQDVPRKVELPFVEKNKMLNKLKVAWISRISRKKNLLGAIQVLSSIDSQYSVFLKIYGPIEDVEYWNECMDALNQLPTNVHWEYLGEVDSTDVVKVLQQDEVFLFPTFGENYGHVIQEALSAGCPVIVSDQTPWQTLEANDSGFSFSLDNLDNFAKEIEKYAAEDAEHFNVHAKNAYIYAQKNSSQNKSLDQYRRMFRKVGNKK